MLPFFTLRSCMNSRTASMWQGKERNRFSLPSSYKSSPISGNCYSQSQRPEAIYHWYIPSAFLATSKYPSTSYNFVVVLQGTTRNRKDPLISPSPPELQFYLYLLLALNILHGSKNVTIMWHVNIWLYFIRLPPAVVNHLKSTEGPGS